MDQKTIPGDGDPLRDLNSTLEHIVRSIVREEITAALRTLVRAAEGLDGYDTDIIEGSALSMIKNAVTDTVLRLTCPHEERSEYRSDLRCNRCGEPGPEMKNPFEETTDDQS